MLDLSIQFIQGILIIKIKGNLTSDTSYILENNFNKVLKKSESKYILLNLKEVEIIDKEGIKTVKRCFYKILKNGGKFMIYGMDEKFKDDVKNNINLYQINDEKAAHRIVNLWLI